MQINRSNLAMDGTAIMERGPLFDWYCRALLMLNRHLLRQLPTDFDVEVDSSAFLQSMSLIVDGQRVPGQVWDMAPTAPVHKSTDSNTEGG